MSENIYKFSVNTDKKILDISDDLYGIFFEDINRCADGGIYAEMVQNRSFENFYYATYDDRQSGENGISKGRCHEPLRYWYGDTDKAEPLCKGGLEEYFGIDPVGDGLYYVKVCGGATLINRGFGSEKELCGMCLKKGENYNFSIYAKSENGAEITAALIDGEEKEVSGTAALNVAGGGKWQKYEAVLTVTEKDCLGQLRLCFGGECCIDTVSLFPENVWGRGEGDSPTAHKNYLGNPNYRLRKDLMETLYDMRPAFMRFPGGCISEGSYIWENVYDWKDSVGDAAIRKENFNVWGYVMTMGLGYMEYFQMAEDLGAEPVPVMACGILCQARSDYVDPAGGKLREKYIQNFTDLVDFAVSTDFEGSKWARLRKEMGHEAPFGLHYLGIGNENWGDEFFADFEVFYREIKKYIDENYPEQGIKIISTVGAQADDDAMKRGWDFLCGGYRGGGKMRFTDGEKGWEEDVTRYEHKKHYLDTVADEHYYRNNEYLLENADRYNYYQRGSYTFAPDEVEEKGLLPQVFVGEYASNERNTLRGAVAEAAAMTGFERNGDIVKMAATAPLFNQPMDDGTYRWVPDCIWFDKDTVWRTPTYFVQQMFMRNTGSRLLETREYLCEGETETEYRPKGGFGIAASKGKVWFRCVFVDKDGKDVCNIDFAELNHSTESLADFLENRGLKCSDISKVTENDFGIVLDGTEKTVYIYSADTEHSGYRVTATAKKLDENAVIEVCAGLADIGENADMTGITVTKYCVGDPVHGTGLKVVKRGKEGYTLGDFASSVYAGNLRAYYNDKVSVNNLTGVTLDYGSEDSAVLKASYRNEESCLDENYGELNCRLEAHSPIYSSATADNGYIYVKLVNAGDTDKKVRVEISGADTEQSGELTVLTAAPWLCGTENVNVNGEKVVPKISEISEISKGAFEAVLHSQSVNILKAKTR